MVGDYKKYIEEISNKTGFIKSTLEKVERLLNILEWINNHQSLSKLLALKGGTAINTIVFNFPRLSVDIDMDFIENLSKNEMIREREFIHNLIIQYLNANDYKINIEKSKKAYALDSIVAEYEDIRGNIDNIKIEINYMKRVHILETKQLRIDTDIFEDKKFKIHCIHPIEVYAAKICALLNRTTARDLFDVYTLSKYDLFDKKEKNLLRKCFMLEYIAINNYKIEGMNIERIEKLDKQDIKIKLLPTLKNRNPKNNNVDEMKQVVREYLKDILIIDDATKEFYDKFQKGMFEPELLFDSEKNINKIKEHPMIMWKLNKTNN
ncbi:MAG: nucleotidyl transferase AbiEii/AbiGii toxin family protein [Clostridia bacterium]|nr:nucleotidyl transferase AbiEii/AbiGii toxin family protein [Clostridia bacterium]